MAKTKKDKIITKIDTDNFDVEETVNRTVNKKDLKAQIKEIEDIIVGIKSKTNLTSLENDLQTKNELLALLK